MSPIRAKAFESDHLLDAVLPAPGACARFHRDEEIFGEGEGRRRFDAERQ